MWQDMVPWLMAIIAFVGLILTIWRMRVSDLNRLDDKREALRAELFSEIAKVGMNVSLFKLHVAETYPTSRELSDSEARLTGAMNELTKRIDRWLERHQ